MCFSFSISSWWIGDLNDQTFPIEKLHWDKYTHIHYGGPIYHEKTGAVYCNKTDHNLKKMVRLAHKHNVKIMWGGGKIPLYDMLWNNKMTPFKQNLIQTIGRAARECNVDGIEIDYEYSILGKNQLGIITPEESTRYSIFLALLKKAMGPTKLVAADISIEGIGRGEWVLGVLPWINVTMLNRGDFDYINTMSYHWSRYGSIWAWEKDMFFIDLWGIDRKRVNVGLPYFSTKFWQHSSDEPSWQQLSLKCPNIDPSLNVCNEIVFVGKQMNYDIGHWIRKGGFRGAFPWAANYDSIQHNNSLITWLYNGLENRL